MTNDEVIGYMLLACKNLKINKQVALDLFHEMNAQFEWKTEDEAEELGYKWLNSIED